MNEVTWSPTTAVKPQNTQAYIDSNSNKVVIVYRDDDNSRYGTAVVGTVSNSTPL